MGVDARAKLACLLQLAYSGELAAAYAYGGHKTTLADPRERAQLARVEADEWHHRRLVGAMLVGLGAAPRFWREARAFVIGRVLGVLCRLAGWFLPMYAAGRLERRNVGEYVVAAELALACGRADLVEPLLAMAEAEWDHEAFFRGCVARHAWVRVFPLWKPLPPRASIRAKLLRGRRRRPAPWTTRPRGDLSLPTSCSPDPASSSGLR